MSYFPHLTSNSSFQKKSVFLSERKNILFQQIWLRGWDSQILLDKLLTLCCECESASRFFALTHTHVCNDSAPQWWALTDPEDDCRDQDPKTRHAYCQSHLCVSQENYCATLDLAIRFSLSPHLPNWLL